MSAATLPRTGVSAHWRELEETLSDIGHRFRRAALASSLSAEDMVMTHAIAALGAPIEVFVIDTGRLHAETLAVLAELQRRYALAVEVLRPVSYTHLTLPTTPYV